MDTRINNSDPTYENNSFGLSMAVGAIASGANVNIDGCVTGGKYSFDGNSWNRSDGKALAASDLALIDQFKASSSGIKSGDYDLKGVSGALISVNGDIMAGGIVQVQAKIDLMTSNKDNDRWKDWFKQVVGFLFGK